MLSFTLNGKLGKAEFNLPTNLKEITPEYLNQVTKDVIVADYHVLVGLCYREKLSDLIFTYRNKKEATTSVIPLFVKRGNVDDVFQGYIKQGDKLIIGSSNLAMGHHVTCVRNNITINNFLAYVDGDAEAYQKALKLNEYVYFLEFKIVPANTIVGCYTDLKGDESYNNPFKVVVSKNV